MPRSSKPLQLIEQLKSAGAKVVTTHRSKTRKSKIVASTKAGEGVRPQEFGAWVSWSKSF